MRRSVAFACAAAFLLAACSSDGASQDAATAGSAATPADGPSGHSHSHEGGESLPPAGDGTSAYQIGYTLRDVTLPRAAGEPGRLSFVVENFRGRPQRRFLEELSKEMHVYVVRDDYAVFRHVHPQMQPDGTWVGNLTLPEPGDYRVVAEFLARDEGGDGDFVMLGREVTVPGRWQRRPPPTPDGTAADWGVEATVVSKVTPGPDGRMLVRLTTPEGDAPRLGSYLGESAHLTGFHVRSGRAVHMHPTGPPSTSDHAATLSFHTQLPRPGTYALFLQVTVDGFLHTLPLAVSAV